MRANNDISNELRDRIDAALFRAIACDGTSSILRAVKDAEDDQVRRVPTAATTAAFHGLDDSQSHTFGNVVRSDHSVQSATEDSDQLRDEHIN